MDMFSDRFRSLKKGSMTTRASRMSELQLLAWRTLFPYATVHHLPYTPTVRSSYRNVLEHGTVLYLLPRWQLAAPDANTKASLSCHQGHHVRGRPTTVQCTVREANLCCIKCRISKITHELQLAVRLNQCDTVALHCKTEFDFKSTFQFQNLWRKNDDVWMLCPHFLALLMTRVRSPFWIFSFAFSVRSILT